jgi:Spy/CpxP family protein refolding chaperone
MLTRQIVGILTVLALALPAVAADAPTSAPAVAEPLGRAFDELIGQMYGLGERFRAFSLGGAAPEPPVITIMLEHRREMNLTPAQVQELERIRTAFQRDAIKLEADRRVAEIDLGSLLGSDPVDMVKAEGKIREIERVRADLRVSRLRAIERGKAQLTPEQRTKLSSLLGEAPSPHAGGALPGLPLGWPQRF